MSPTHDPTAPAAPDSPPAWAVEAAKEINVRLRTHYVNIATIIAKHAPATPATSAAKGGDIPRTPTDSEALARLFHDTYERLAPEYGYETRPETRVFDPNSKNGKLMIAVCAAIAAAMMKGVRG